MHTHVARTHAHHLAGSAMTHPGALVANTESVDTPIDAAATQPTGEPEAPQAEVAQLQTDDAKPADEPKPKEELSDEQKTSRNAQRRIERLAADRAALRRENEMLREQNARIQQREPTDEGEPKAVAPQDIERLATERAKELQKQQDFAKRTEAVVEAGRKIPGFQAAVSAVADEVPFADARGVPTPFIDAVLDSDKPAELLAWLGKNPEEAAAFANLSPAQIGRRLARLEDRIEREAKVQTSSAPVPLKPLQSKAVADKDPGAMSDAEFATWRHRQIAQRR